MNWVTVWNRILPGKEIGWKEIDETFYRWTIIGTPWFHIYLHHLICEAVPDHYHDHPWSFWAILLGGGYWEDSPNEGTIWRRPGSILRRPATFAHRVWTKPTGSWSIIITGRKFRTWEKEIPLKIGKEST